SQGSGRPAFQSQRRQQAGCGDQTMTADAPRRVVSGHDRNGKSVVLSDGPPPQHHSMHGPEVGADFFEIWNCTRPVPLLTATEAEPNERVFTIMPVVGHLLRLIEI